MRDSGVRYRPISPERLVGELADRIASLPADRWSRVAVDGSGTAADPAGLADSLVEPLRVRGREVLRVSAWDFLRPASLRFERGRTDPDVRYEDWLDTGALRREVLGPLEPGGSGEVLPALWDRERDRAHRLPRTTLPAGAVLLLDGELLLGHGLRFDLTVHLWLSPAALERRTPPESHWALPAYARYERDVQPALTADVVVRMDRPHHPAVREP
ncbi:uridine kinase [Prauserella oleivorans]|uniref:Uridine kinase n=1 Tax=Prauserella oleivorans TaxID=1478153 RepID=A0ABW5WAA5_9PSEU